MDGRGQALRNRSSEEVLAAHLQRRKEGDVEVDLEENYWPDVVVLTARAVFLGHEGVRRSAHRLWTAIRADGWWHCSALMVRDRTGLLEWRGGSDRHRIRCGVDSYLVEDGWIKAQTIHYVVEDMALSTTTELSSA